MPEIGLSGSEGGGADHRSPYPYMRLGRWPVGEWGSAGMRISEVGGRESISDLRISDFRPKRYWR